jgi:glycosyltransferase involved in cell wall biosynthesis
MFSKERKPDVSIIIPTHNRAGILKESIEKLINQDYPKNLYEIIVIDDGSTDTTKEVIENAAKNSPVSIKYFFQKNQGQGIARNFGLRYAQGKIIIFGQDDILVLSDFIKQHVRFHTKYPQENVAVLGFIAWDPRLQITPFMDWLTNGSSVLGKFGGHQFAFEKLQNKQTADYNFFYTSNISLKASLIKKNPFDSRFSSYGWEDIELGYRLTKNFGLVIYYNPSAVGYHSHPMDESSLAARMKQIGASAHLIHSKYPELNKVPSRFKKFMFFLISNPISLSILKKIREISNDKYSTFYFYALSKKYFLEGLNSKI